MKYPLLLFFIVSSIALQAQKKQVSMLFVGDAMQHMPQVNAAKTKDGGYNYDSCFYLIKERVSAADLAFVNFETTLAGKPYSGYPTFSAPDEFAFGLKDAGFDVFFQANNHAADKGRKGLERTIDRLDSIDIKHTGTFKSKDTRGLYYPLMIIKNGIRIAFLNYSYDTNGIPVPKPNIINAIDTVQIIKDIALAKLYNPDIIIANMHWDEEYMTYPSQQQQKLADLLIKNGVRIVIGNHPHVVQPFVVNKKDDKIGSVVYYSLGNFISNQQKPNTDGGMIAEIVISKDDNKDIEIDSCTYSLVWVHKYVANKKINYILIPSWIESYEDICGMNDTPKQKMDAFIKNAEKIIHRKI